MGRQAEGEKPWDGWLISRENGRPLRRISRGSQGVLDSVTDQEQLKRDGGRT
jgi:hypothetical protein